MISSTWHQCFPQGTWIPHWEHQCSWSRVHKVPRLIFRKNLSAELLLKILMDNPNNLTESRLYRIVDWIIHKCLTVRSKSSKLLQTVVTASHTCSKKKKFRFHNFWCNFLCKLYVCKGKYNYWQQTTFTHTFSNIYQFYCSTARRI